MARDRCFENRIESSSEGKSGVRGGGGGGGGGGGELLFDIDICSNPNVTMDQEAGFARESEASEFSIMTALEDSADETESSVGGSEDSGCTEFSIGSPVGSPHVIPQWMPSPRPGMVFQTIRKDKKIVLEEIRAVRPVVLQPYRCNGRLILREYKNSQHAPVWQACQTYDTYASSYTRDRWKNEPGYHHHSRRRWSLDETPIEDTPPFTPSCKPPLPKGKRVPPLVADCHELVLAERQGINTNKNGSNKKNCNENNGIENNSINWQLYADGSLEKHRSVGDGRRSHGHGLLVRSQSLPVACDGIAIPELHAARFTERPELAEDMASLLEVAAKSLRHGQVKNYDAGEPRLESRVSG